MKTKVKYIAPTLEQEEYMVEGGFTNSLILNPNDNDYGNGFQHWDWTDDPIDNGFGYDDGSGNGNGVGWDWD